MLRNKLIVLLAGLLIASSLSTVFAESPSPTPSSSPTTTQEPTPTPRTVEVRISLLDGNLTVKQAVVAVDGEPKSTGISGVATFQLQVGFHEVAIYLDNVESVRNESLIVTKAQLVKYDVSDLLGKGVEDPTPAPTDTTDPTSSTSPNSVEGSQDISYASASILVIALAGLAVTVILFKSRRN